MKSRTSSITLLVLTASFVALAQGQSPMREGQWEVAVKMNMPGMEMPPMKAAQCITAAMLKDPQSALPKGPGGGDCKVSDYKLSGTTATYTMVCTKPAPMTAVAEMRYSGTDAYTGTMTIDSSGQKMTMSYDAKRVGDCPK